MRTSESIADLTKALIVARRAFAPVRKDTKGQVGQNREYFYAALPGILDATLPALLEHGLVVLQAVDAETSCLITRLAHVSGEWAEATYPLNLDLPPQQLGSSITYARRYSLQGLLNLAAEDDDGAAAQGVKPKPPDPARPTGTDGRIGDAQRRRMFTIAKGSGWSTEAIKAHLKARCQVTSSKDVLLSQYDGLCATFDASPPVVATPAPAVTADDIPF